MEVKILKPLLASKSDPENLRPVFVGIRADFGDIDPALAGIDKVEVLYVKNESVPSKGIVKAPHGKTVFWKPSSDTYTVKTPCWAIAGRECRSPVLVLATGQMHRHVVQDVDLSASGLQAGAQGQYAGACRVQVLEHDLHGQRLRQAAYRPGSHGRYGGGAG